MLKISQLGGFLKKKKSSLWKVFKKVFKKTFYYRRFLKYTLNIYFHVCGRSLKNIQEKIPAHEMKI